MAKTITIKLTGLAEKFIEKMKSEGLNEADVISQGIGILEEIWRTNRVALVKEEFQTKSFQISDESPYKDLYDSDKVLEHYYMIQTPKTLGKNYRN